MDVKEEEAALELNLIASSVFRQTLERSLREQVVSCCFAGKEADGDVDADAVDYDTCDQSQVGKLASRKPISWV